MHFFSEPIKQDNFYAFFLKGFDSKGGKTEREYQNM